MDNSSYAIILLSILTIIGLYILITTIIRPRFQNTKTLMFLLTSVWVILGATFFLYQFDYQPWIIFVLLLFSILVFVFIFLRLYEPRLSIIVLLLILLLQFWLLYSFNCKTNETLIFFVFWILLTIGFMIYNVVEIKNKDNIQRLTQSYGSGEPSR
jgi:peptidoglycan/LPS O-acetylase OafA/YrhL